MATPIFLPVREKSNAQVVFVTYFLRFPAYAAEHFTIANTDIVAGRQLAKT